MLGLGPTGAEKGGGLVQLVQKAHRDQQQSRPQPHTLRHQPVEVGELERHRSGLVGGAVLELDLGVEEESVAELVTHVDDRPQRVDLVGPTGRFTVLALVGEVLVQRLAVAADRDASPDAVDLRRRRTQTEAAAVGARHHLLAQPQLLDLPSERFDLPAQHRQLRAVSARHLPLEQLDLPLQHRNPLAKLGLLRVQDGRGQRHSRDQHEQTGPQDRPSQSLHRDVTSKGEDSRSCVRIM